MKSYVQATSFVKLPCGDLKRRKNKFFYKDIYLEKQNYVDSIAEKKSLNTINNSISTIDKETNSIVSRNKKSNKGINSSKKVRTIMVMGKNQGREKLNYITNTDEIRPMWKTMRSNEKKNEKKSKILKNSKKTRIHPISSTSLKSFDLNANFNLDSIEHLKSIRNELDSLINSEIAKLSNQTKRSCDIRNSQYDSFFDAKSKRFRSSQSLNKNIVCSNERKAVFIDSEDDEDEKKKIKVSNSEKKFIKNKNFFSPNIQKYVNEENESDNNNIIEIKNNLIEEVYESNQSEENKNINLNNKENAKKNKEQNANEMVIENNFYNGKEHDIDIHKTKDMNLNQIKTTKNDYENNKGNNDNINHSISSLNNDGNTNINHKTEMLNTHLINHRNVNSVSYDTQNSILNNNMKSYNKHFSTFKSLSNNHNNNNISKSTEAINLQPKNQLNQKKTFLLTVSSIDSNKNITTNTNNNISSNINTNRNSPYIPKEKTNNINSNSNNSVSIKHLLLSQQEQLMNELEASKARNSKHASTSRKKYNPLPNEINFAVKPLIDGKTLTDIYIEKMKQKGIYRASPRAKRLKDTNDSYDSFYKM